MVKNKKERRAIKARRIANKKLIKKYPFLMPYNVWTGKKLEDYKYNFTWADDLPEGWNKAFGDMMWEDFKNALKKPGEYIQFQQIKEKFGELRVYCSAPESIQNIISAYSHCSQNICIKCGKPDVHIIDTGWIHPVCEECFSKNKWYKDKDYNSYLCDDSGKMADSYSFTRFSKDGNEHITVDISEYTQKIRRRYDERRH